MIKRNCILLFIIFFTNSVLATINPDNSAITAPIPITELHNYSEYPLTVQQLIAKASSLSQENLTYMYGSADPSRKGMDCSGTIYYLLKTMQINNVPRQANEIYQWVWQQGKFYAVTSSRFESFEFSHLRPGDLLFWTGTYDAHRDPPITHVMLYLGKNTQGQPLMFGASDGRTYQGKSMWGVSVFDFKLPNADSKSRFIGYSCIPNLTCDD